MQTGNVGDEWLLDAGDPLSPSEGTVQVDDGLQAVICCGSVGLLLRMHHASPGRVLQVGCMDAFQIHHILYPGLIL